MWDEHRVRATMHVFRCDRIHVAPDRPVKLLRSRDGLCRIEHERPVGHYSAARAKAIPEASRQLALLLSPANVRSVFVEVLLRVANLGQVRYCRSEMGHGRMELGGCECSVRSPIS